MSVLPEVVQYQSDEFRRSEMLVNVECWQTSEKRTAEILAVIMLVNVGLLRTMPLNATI